MKIHLPKHNLTETAHLSIKDIPLAYVDTKNNEYHANVELVKDFASSYSKKISPYDKFDSQDICVFDKSGAMIQLRLRENDGDYFFMPENVTEFTPQNFYCDINIFHKMTFSNDLTFDIKVKVDSYNADETLSTRLLSIFGDAYKRGKSPPNILINHGSMLPESLFYDSESAADFVFVESSDGVNYKGGGEIDIDSFVDAKKNLWLVVDNFGDALKKLGSKTVKVSNPVVFNKNSYAYDGEEIPLFDSSTNFFEDREVTFVSNVSAVFSKQNRGHIIVTSAELFSEQNISALAPVIYETLIFAYCRAYKNIRSQTVWITDEPVNWSAFQKNSINATHPVINLDRLLLQNGIRLSDFYSVLFVETNNDSVIFSSMTESGNLIFQKIVASDPVKNPNQISCLTTKGTVIFYEPTDQYEWVEEPLLITERISGAEIFIQVNPCKNSRHKIFSTETQELKIPDNRYNYVLCAKPIIPPMTSVFNLILESEYSSEIHGTKIADVNVNTTFNTNLVDLRISGGGLPLISADNYDLIDIGNALGRPFSKNSVLIFRLPKKYSIFKERIQAEIEKHISAGDYPILIFEQRTVI